MCTKLPTPYDKLSTEPINSPPKNKFRTILKVLIVDSKEDEERTYSNKMGGGDSEEFEAIAMWDNLEEEPKPNLDRVIDNIQIEHVEPIELVVPIAKSKEPIVVAT